MSRILLLDTLQLFTQYLQRLGVGFPVTSRALANTSSVFGVEDRGTKGGSFLGIDTNKKCCTIYTMSRGQPYSYP